MTTEPTNYQMYHILLDTDVFDGEPLRWSDDGQHILICEGELDALSAMRSGVPAIATGGTST